MEMPQRGIVGLEAGEEIRIQGGGAALGIGPAIGHAGHDAMGEDDAPGGGLGGHRPMAVGGILILVRDGEELDRLAVPLPPQELERRGLEQGDGTEIEPAQLSGSAAQPLVVAGQEQEFAGVAAGVRQQPPHIPPQAFGVGEGVEQVAAEKQEIRPLPARRIQQLAENAEAVVLLGFGQVEVGGVEEADHASPKDSKALGAPEAP